MFRPILHKYANEDVSLGAWFIGLDVEHINDHNMCCGTPPGTSFIFLLGMVEFVRDIDGIFNSFTYELLNAGYVLSLTGQMT